MSKFNELYSKILFEAVSSDVLDFHKRIIITVLDAEKDRQVRLVPFLKVKLSTSDRVAKKNWSVLDISFVKNGDKDPRGIYPQSSPIYLASPVGKFNESGIYPRCEISIDKLSDPLKSYLRSEELDDFGKTLDYWNVKDDEGFEKQFGQIADKLGKLLFNEYQSSSELKDILDPQIGKLVSRDFEYKEKTHKEEEDSAAFKKSLERPSEEEPSFVSDDEDNHEIEFSHWFRGLNNQRYHLIGAKIEAHPEDGSFDYDYGSAHGVYYDYSVEIDDIVWICEDPDGNRLEVDDSKAEELIGLKKNDKYKAYIEDWFTKNTDLGSDMRSGYYVEH